MAGRWLSSWRPTYVHASSRSNLGDERHHYTTKGFCRVLGAVETTTPLLLTVEAGLPLPTTVAEPVTMAFEAGVDLSISQGLGGSSPDGHLIEVMGHTHGPLKILPGFIPQGARVEMEG
jgi:hypothetical protein